MSVRIGARFASNRGDDRSVTVFNGERLEGIHRWHEWFSRCLSTEPTVRDVAWDLEPACAVWTISFRNGAEACVQVTEESLRLGEEDFDALVMALEERGSLSALVREKSGDIRIHPDGAVDEMEPEPAG